MKNSYWLIEGDNNTFDTLKDAKWHVDIAYTPKERVKYLRSSYILHVVRDEVVSSVEIIVSDDGAFKFGKSQSF